MQEDAQIQYFVSGVGAQHHLLPNQKSTWDGIITESPVLKCHIIFVQFSLDHRNICLNQLYINMHNQEFHDKIIPQTMECSDIVLGEP
jgi:hypothetical protein